MVLNENKAFVGQPFDKTIHHHHMEVFQPKLGDGGNILEKQF